MHNVWESGSSDHSRKASADCLMWRVKLDVLVLLYLGFLLFALFLSKFSGSLNTVMTGRSPQQKVLLSLKIVIAGAGISGEIYAVRKSAQLKIAKRTRWAWDYCSGTKRDVSEGTSSSTMKSNKNNWSKSVLCVGKRLNSVSSVVPEAMRYGMAYVKPAPRLTWHAFCTNGVWRNGSNRMHKLAGRLRYGMVWSISISCERAFDFIF